MSSETPQIPAGSGQHPIVQVRLSADRTAASATFYSLVFGWTATSHDERVVLAPVDGPAMVIASADAGMTARQGSVPFIAAGDIDAVLARIAARGGTRVGEPWEEAGAHLAYFKDPSGTIYGLTTATPSTALARMPSPIGPGPKPRPGSLCSLEMYAASGDAAAAFFGEVFGYGSLATMPQFMAFDAGAGIGGVFQSHTPTLPAVPYMFVDDVAGVIEKIEEAGGKRTSDPMSAPGMGTFGYFTDPAGTNAGLIGP